MFFEETERIKSKERVKHPASGKRLDDAEETTLLRKPRDSNKKIIEYESVYAAKPFPSKEKLKEFKKSLIKKLNDLGLKHSEDYGAKVVHLLSVLEEKHEDGPFVRVAVRTYFPNYNLLKELSPEEWSKAFEKKLYEYHNKAKQETKALLEEREKQAKESLKELLKKLLKKYPKKY